MSKTPPPHLRVLPPAPELSEALTMDASLRDMLGASTQANAATALLTTTRFVLHECEKSPALSGQLAVLELAEIGINGDPCLIEDMRRAANSRYGEPEGRDLQATDILNRTAMAGPEAHDNRFQPSLNSNKKPEKFIGGVAIFHYCLRNSRAELGLGMPVGTRGRHGVGTPNVDTAVEGRMARTLFTPGNTVACQATNLFGMSSPEQEGPRWVLSTLTRRNPLLLFAYARVMPADTGTARSSRTARRPAKYSQSRQLRTTNC